MHVIDTYRIKGVAFSRKFSSFFSDHLLDLYY